MRRILPAIAVLIIAGLIGWFVLTTNARGSETPVRLGLDLAGGTELVYRAETGDIVGDKKQALAVLRQVIEERINVFGVAEPLVQVEQSSAVAGAQEDRLLVQLPGVTDVKAAVDAIGQTPLLEFKLAKSGPDGSPVYIDTGLTGRYLDKADLQFGSQNGGVGSEPIVVITFNSEGSDLFAKITGENVGQTLAIFLDGQPISTPTIQEAILGGTATITGGFSPTEARDLVQNLNFGALPVAINLVSSSSVGPTLGGEAFQAGLAASAVGFLLVALFMILWYRLPGLVASAALVIYVLITVALIKFIPITLTASGIAGFILSIGMAVDANVLIFERMKEELRAGKGPHDAAKIGFSRAWPAIRDGHFTMLISAVILFWMGTSLVKGFALVFGFGVIVSLFSAVTITQTFLNALLPNERKGIWKFLLGSGIRS
ncbi:protein translocase subunit SecD [Patescibacteria group bacterium]|nr:protein translocase subunit SecD [Patescibacteria group bacterium]MBU1755039.1 protein translocase subunit SecD [Patescibacteria group bacterium]